MSTATDWVAKHAQRSPRRDSRSFEAVAELMQDDASEAEAMGIFLFALMGQSSNQEFRTGMLALESVAPTWQSQGAPALKALQLLREQVPALSEVLSAESLSEVLPSKAAWDQHMRVFAQMAAREDQAQILQLIEEAGFATQVAPVEGSESAG